MTKPARAGVILGSMAVGLGVAMGWSWIAAGGVVLALGFAIVDAFVTTEGRKR